MLLTYRETTKTHRDEHQETKQISSYERGEEIPLLDGGVWQLYRGFVQLSTLHSNGDDVILNWAKQGAFFGKWLARSNNYRATALSNVYIAWYSLPEIETNSQLARAMLTEEIKAMQQRESLLAIAKIKLVEDRLHHLLFFLQEEMGETREEGIRLKARLTHQNIADAIRTTRVTVTKLLGDFQGKGLVAFDEERHLIIKS